MTFTENENNGISGEDVSYAGWSSSSMSSSSSANANAIKANAEIIERAMPWVSSNALLAQQIATSGIDPVTLATTGNAALSVTQAGDFAYTLSQQSPSYQRAIYDDLTASQRASLSEVGYTAPPSDDIVRDLSFQEKVLGYAVGGIGKAFEYMPARQAIAWAGGEVLDKLFVVGDQPAHLYRTIRGMDVESQLIAGAGAVAAVALSRGRISPRGAIGTFQALSRVGGVALAGATAAGFASNPSRWIESWNASADGERFFDPNVVADVQKELNGNEDYERLAKDIATDLDPYDIAVELAGVRDALRGGQFDISFANSRIYDIAKQYADPGTPEHRQVLEAISVLLEQPEFLRQVTRLAQNKISPGRDVARMISNVSGFEVGGTGYNLVSGAVDATWLLSLDPLLALGPAWNSARLARYAAFPTKVRSGAAVEMGSGKFLERMLHLHETNRKMRAMNRQIVRAANRGSYRMMPANMRSLFNPLRTWAEQEGLLVNGKWIAREIDGQTVTGLTDADLFEFYATQEAIGLFMSGTGTRLGIAERVFQPIPESSALGRFRRELLEFRDAFNEPFRNRQLRKLAEKNGFDLDNAHRLGLEDLGTADQVVKLAPIEPQRVGILEPGGVGRALGKTLSFVPFVPVAGRTIGKIIGATSKMQSRGVINLRTGDGVSEFVNTIGEIYNLPQWFVNGYVDNVMRQTNEAAKLQVIRSFYEGIFDLTGLRDTRAGRELYDMYVKKIYESYSVGGVDSALVNSRGLVRGRGVLPGQIVDNIAVPNGAEILAAKRSARFLEDVAGVQAARDVMDVSTNRYWKPAVLVSLRYIVRSIGEELLTSLARGTQGQWGNEVATRLRARFDDFIVVQNKVRQSTQGLSVLTPDELAIYNWGNDTFMGKRITSLFGNTGGGNIDHTSFENYRSWLYRVVESGLGGQWELLNKFNNMGQLKQSILLGRRNSWRRTLLNGTEKMTFNNARVWNRMHARSVMNRVSAGSQGLNAEQIIHPTNVPMFQGAGDLPVPVFADPSGYKGYIPEDEFFQHAVLHQTQQLFNNELIGQPILQPAFLRLLPEEIQAEDLAQVLEAVGTIPSPVLRDWFFILAFGKDDQLEALASQLRHAIERNADGTFVRPELVNEFTRASLTVTDVENFADGLIAYANSQMKTVDAWSSQLRVSAQANNVIDRFFQVADNYVPFFRSLDESGFAYNYYMPAIRAHSAGLQYGTSPFSDDVIRSVLNGTYDANNFDAATRWYTDVEQWEDDLFYALTQEALTGPSREYVRDSEFMIRSQGEHLRLQEMPARGSTTLYTPNIVDISRLDALFNTVLQRGLTDADPTFFDDVAELLMQSPEATRAAHGYLNTQNAEELREYLVSALRTLYYNLSDSATGVITRAPAITYPGGTAVAQGFEGRLAFDNPRVALWLNHMINGMSATNESHTLLVRQILRKEANAPVSPWLLGDTTPTTNPLPIQRERSGPLGNVFLLSPEERAALVPVYMGDGTQTYAGAVGNFVEQQFEHIRYTAFSGSTETITVKDGVFQLDINGVPQPVPSGTQVRRSNDFVDANGNQLSPDDRTFFIREAHQSDDSRPMWQIIGPAITDSIDARSGTQLVRRKRMENADDGNYVALTHSRVTNVTDMPSKYAPQIAVGPRMTFDPNATKEHILRRGVSKFFEMNGAAIDAMNRTPLAFHFFNQRHTQNLRFVNDFLMGPSDDGVRYVAPMMDELIVGLQELPNGKALINEIAETYGDMDAGVYFFLDELFADVPTEVVDKLRRGDITVQDFLYIASASEPTSGVAIENTLGDIAFGLQRVTPDEWMYPAFGNMLELLDGRALGQELLSIRNFREIAAERAAYATIDDVMPFVDSHELKSVFSLYVKNLMPFWYAEENFLKRWVRGAANNGTYGLLELRKAQLGYMGGRSSGIIQEDQYGDKWIVYPGSGAFNKLVTNFYGRFDAPTNYVFKSRIDSLLPGFNDQAGRPGIGPWGAIPLTALARAFPEIQPLRRLVVGDIGATKGFTEQISQFVVPTAGAKLLNLAVNGDEKSNIQLANAMTRAMQLSAAADEWPDANASPVEWQNWYDDIKQDAKGILFSSYVFGFFSPGTPFATPITEGPTNMGFWTGIGVTDPKQLLNPIYRRYMYLYGPDEGLEKFKEYAGTLAPDAILNPEMFGVSTSTTVTGAPLAVTQEAVNFYLDNDQDATEFAYAFSWLTPVPPIDSEWDNYAWFEQFNHELRQKKDPKEYQEALIFRRAAPFYFAMRERHLAEKEAFVGDADAKALMNLRHDTEVAEFIAENPMFAQMLQNSEARVRRQQTITEMRVFYNDPAKEEKYGSDPRFEAMKLMINSFDWWRASRAAYQGNSKRALEERAVVDAEMARFLGDWLLYYPDMRTFYVMIIEPELNDNTESLVAQIEIEEEE